MKKNELESLRSTLSSIESEDKLIYTLITQRLIKLLRSDKNIDVRDVLDLLEWRKQYKEKIGKKISHQNTWGNYNTTD